ncbi:MAG TPA: UvrD-helicase domain-containing protein [Ignavibacteriales bacterium]|nr:UvrD-helicase domain-containing protein [Ignavibacteriales bacterium]
MQINTYIKKPFDLTNIPLEGFNLIEASAGTGKTYNITKLIIRFLLDKKLSISDILVVTFTNAATYELQNRIINELYETNKIINNSENLQPESNVWHKYLSYLIKNNGIENLQKTIKKAINEFQNANIFTIHSFCNKLLKLYAFESSSPFNLNILKDSDKLFDKYYNDFKRIHFTNLEYFVYNLIHKFIDDDEIRKIVFFAGADFYRGKHNDKIEDIFEIINKKVEQIKTLLSKFPESGISSRKAKKTIPNQINEKYISPYNQPIDEKKYDKIKNELKKINDDKNNRRTY